MKITYKDIESFVKNPSPKTAVILTYGPDSGLVKERADIMGKTVVTDLNDPFNAVTLTPEILSEDPSRLIDEANALSMMGGRRLIRIKNADDSLTTLIQSYLENINENALILIEASELSPRSSLRKLCEKEKTAAAVPCYIEDERDIAKFIRRTLQDNKISADEDAILWLSANIGGNRQKARSELEKLLIYKGEDTSTLSIQDAQNACGSAGAATLDDLIYAVAGNNRKKALSIYTGLMQDDVPFIVILRSLQNHFRRLHLTKARSMENGTDNAMKSLSPPIFFKYKNAFKAQTERWKIQSLENILKKLSALETQSKKTGYNPEILCAQAILGIASMRG